MYKTPLYAIIFVQLGIQHMTHAYNRTCAENEIACKNGRCLPSSQFVCDFWNDCGDKSDELNCACSKSMFECNITNTCMPRNYVCDGIKDCEDGQDERGCVPIACNDNQFQCANGYCIDILGQCDLDWDCADGSDEWNCPCNTSFAFDCNNGKCIRYWWTCDLIDDCGDRSDERLISCQCDKYHYQCANGQCVPKWWLCDDVVDCSDRTDEINCRCGTNNFMCDDRTCISNVLRCDKTRDCADNSDEKNCLCDENPFICGDGKCISKRSKCNLIFDCADRSDERNCTFCFPNGTVVLDVNYPGLYKDPRYITAVCKGYPDSLCNVSRTSDGLIKVTGCSVDNEIHMTFGDVLGPRILGGKYSSRGYIRVRCVQIPEQIFVIKNDLHVVVPQGSFLSSTVSCTISSALRLAPKDKTAVTEARVGDVLLWTFDLPYEYKMLPLKCMAYGGTDANASESSVSLHTKGCTDNVNLAEDFVSSPISHPTDINLVRYFTTLYVFKFYNSAYLLLQCQVKACVLSSNNCNIQCSSGRYLRSYGEEPEPVSKIATTSIILHVIT